MDPSEHPADPAARESAWARVLDQMEAGLAEHHRALLEGGEHPGPVVVPEGIGPLPVTLRARAEAVLAATRRMEAEVEIHRDALRGALRRRAHVEGREAAAYVDARA